VRKETGDKSSIAQTLITIGDIYVIDSNYSEAINYHLQGLQLFKDVGKEAPDWGLPFAYRSLGSDYEIKANTAFGSNNKKSGKDFSLQAVQYYLLALIEYRKSSVLEGVPFTNMSLGNLYLKLGNTIKAKYYLQESIDEFKRINTLPALQNAYSLLPYLDSINGNFRKALEDYKKFMRYTFRIYNNENNKKIMHSKMQYDFDKKNALAKAEQDKKDAEEKRIKNQQYFIIAALGLIVLAVLTIALIQLKNNKQKRKANLLLKDEKQKVEITLSELKSTQAQLIQSEKMASLGELTAGIAHEIQNPLNFVNNFSEVNKELIDEATQANDSGNPNEVKELLTTLKDNEEKIIHHGKRADAIVKGMLQHSRSSTGVKEPTNINALADEYLRLSYHGLRAKDKEFNATMKTDFDETIGKINIVPQDIGRVLLNLYNNAFYAVSEKAKQQPNGYEPTISVSTKKINNSIELTVKDNGNGIPQKVVDKIFQPFFTTKPTGVGTGLGLSLSYDIIKAHGGEIKVNTIEGEFTEFVVQLPIST
jgi:two-component system, NtrC family, sensor kinase